jgi:hypothetical protein
MRETVVGKGREEVERGKRTVVIERERAALRPGECGRLASTSRKRVKKQLFPSGFTDVAVRRAQWGVLTDSACGPSGRVRLLRSCSFCYLMYQEAFLLYFGSPLSREEAQFLCRELVSSLGGVGSG